MQKFNAMSLQKHRWCSQCVYGSRAYQHIVLLMVMQTICAWKPCLPTISLVDGDAHTMCMQAIQDRKVHGSNMGPSGSCWPQMGPMLAPWTLLSEVLTNTYSGRWWCTQCVWRPCLPAQACRRWCSQYLYGSHAYQKCNFLEWIYEVVFTYVSKSYLRTRTLGDGHARNICLGVMPSSK